jgi:uncharacterized protein
MPKPKARRSPARTTQTRSHAQPPTVSPVWLITVLSSIVVGSLALAWGALCFLFWQGSWQLLYHPTSKLTRTPASVGLPFDAVGLATTESGAPRLSGWWIPAAPAAPFARYTALYLHGATGNLSNTVDDLQRLHAAGLTILAIDYRGYGQSKFVHPSEARFRQDAEWAIQYLTGTRHVAPATILLVGQDLGADLSLEVADAHPNLAGVVLLQPRLDPTSAIFRDPRARMVPAHWLTRERWDLSAAAAQLRVPSLWVDSPETASRSAQSILPEPFKRTTAPKSIIWLVPSPNLNQDLVRVLANWLRDLPNQRRNLPGCQLSDGGPC